MAKICLSCEYYNIHHQFCMKRGWILGERIDYARKCRHYAHRMWSLNQKKQ